MFKDEILSLEKKLDRLIAAYRQVLLERRKAQQERDRLLAVNAELRQRIENIVERIRALEIDA